MEAPRFEGVDHKQTQRPVAKGFLLRRPLPPPPGCCFFVGHNMTCAACLKQLHRLSNAVPALHWSSFCDESMCGSFAGENFGIAIECGAIEGAELYMHDLSAPVSEDGAADHELAKREGRYVNAARTLYWRNKNRIYRARMNHGSWQRVRCDVLRRDDFECVRCGSPRSLDVHHLTYERFGKESIHDCVTLCRSCHKEVEAK